MIWVALIYLILHLVSVSAGGNYLWGTDSWSFLPHSFALFIFILGIISLIPKVQNSLKPFLAHVLEKLQKIPFYIWLILFVIFAYYLSPGTYFLGDGYLRIRNVERGLLFMATEPLDTILHGLLYKLLNPILGFTGAEVYKWTSILSGVGFIIILRKYIPLLIDDKRKSSVFIIILLLSGFIQLFFGYVESYSIVAFVLSYFLLSTMSMLKTKRYSILSAILFVLACTLHTISVFLLPAFIFSYYKLLFKIEIENKNRKLITILLILIVSPITILFAIGLLSGISPISVYNTALVGKGQFLSIFTNNLSYGILSQPHLIDIINLLVLSSPAFISLLFVFRNFRSIVFKNNENLFLAISAIIFLLLMITLNPLLGMSRDWDLFSLLTILGVILILILLFRENTKNLYQTCIILLSISICHTIPWILTNANDATSTARAEWMVQTPYWSNHSKATLYDELSVYYLAKGNKLKSATYGKLAYDYQKNYRYLERSGALFSELNMLDDAIVCYEILLESGKNLDVINSNLGDLYRDKKSPAKAEEHYVKSLQINPLSLNAEYNLAILYMNSQRFTLARARLNHALQIEAKNPQLNFYMSVCFLNLKEYDLALKYIDSSEKYGYNINVLNGLRKVVNDQYKNKK